MTNDTFLSAVKAMCKNCIHSLVCSHTEDAEGYAERLDACSAIKPAPMFLSLQVKCEHFQEQSAMRSGSFPLESPSFPQQPYPYIAVGDPPHENPDITIGDPPYNPNIWSYGSAETHSTPDPNIHAYSKHDGVHTPSHDSTLDRIRRGEGLKPLGGDTSGIYIEGSNKKTRKR